MLTPASRRWTVTEVDPAEAATHEDIAELRRAVHAADMPDAPGLSLTIATGPTQIHRLVRDRGGDVLGELRAVLREGSNAHQMTVNIAVHPQARRQGIGRCLAEEARRIAEERGRTVLTGTVHAQWPGGPPRSPAGVPFAEAVGYAMAVAEVRSKLATADIAGLAGIHDAALAASREYETQGWIGQVPDELLEAVAKINTHFMGDHPVGELQTNPTPITVATLERENAAAVSGGTFPYGIVARHRDTGEIVAHTVIRVPPGEESHAKQWLTIVMPEHRGHRLADRVKVENLRQLIAGHPDVTSVWTESAESNAAMRRINERMGFTVVDRWLKFQQVR